jgi:hypothetical protein
MEAIVVDHVEVARPQLGHQPQIGVMLPEEGDVIGLGDAGFEQARLVADRLDAQRRVRPRGREQRHVMAASPKRLGQHMCMHLETTGKGFDDSMFQMRNDGDAQLRYLRETRALLARRTINALRPIYIR